MGETPTHDQGDRKRGYFIRSQFFAAPSLAPGLYVVATPIGNLGDITVRALDTIAGADLLACEDTRVTRKLLSRYGIEAAVMSYHEHSVGFVFRCLRCYGSSSSAGIRKQIYTSTSTDELLNPCTVTSLECYRNK
jgi:hypothetical protein